MMAPQSVQRDLRLTIGISTRNRHETLLKTLRSLEKLDEWIGEIIIVDDASDEPLKPVLLPEISAMLVNRLHIERQEHNDGYIVARNRIASMAKHQFILSLDDDIEVLNVKAVEDAIETIKSSNRIAAVAFAQGDAEGRPWPPQTQSAPVNYPCIVPSFIGFAALIRRDVFLSVGGYRETFIYYSEEKELGLRLMDQGYIVVYLPDAVIAHHVSKSGRQTGKGEAYGARNDCLSALYNLPLPLTPLMIVRTLLRYASISPSIKGREFGLLWVLRQLRPRILNILFHERQPVKFSTLRRWDRVRQERPRFMFNPHHEQSAKEDIYSGKVN